METRDLLYTPENFAEVGRLYSTGMDMTAIAQFMTEKLGDKISDNMIRTLVKKFEERKGAVIETDEEIQNEIRGSVREAVNELKGLKDELRHIVDGVDTNNKEKIAAIKELRNIIETNIRIMDRLMSGFDVNKVNKLQVTQVIINMLPDLEKQGYIKILRRPGEVPDLEELRKLESEQNESSGNVIEAKTERR